MLSVLIPIYNFNAFELVRDIQIQCELEKISYEIICQDDASQSELNIKNQEINTLQNCSFISLTNNLGHRQNRNSLAEKAKFEYLLFIDGDSKIIKNDFIKKYIIHISSYDVIYGGRKNLAKNLSDNQKLRWLYGNKFENKTSEKRNRDIYLNLLFNNTLIKTDLFKKIQFDKEIKMYGHDDTQFSFNLKKINAKVLHIDNEVQNDDIDTNEIFIKKTEEALLCLKYLYESKKVEYNYLKILKVYDLLNKTSMVILVSKIFKKTKPFLHKNLTSKQPSLFLFNLYRVGYLCSL